MYITNNNDSYIDYVYCAHTVLEYKDTKTLIIIVSAEHKIEASMGPCCGLDLLLGCMTML